LVWIAMSRYRHSYWLSQSKQLTRRVDAILSALPVIPLTQPLDRAYATIRSQLTNIGKPIGPNDLLIAAHALCEELTLVTANQK